MTKSAKDTVKAEPQTMAYDSNPFTLSFRAFGDLFTYAKNVAIIALAFGAIGFLLNFGGNIIGPLLSEGVPDESTSTTTEVDDLDFEFSFDSEDTSVTSDEFFSDIDAGEVAGALGIFSVILAAILVIAIPIGSVITALWKGFIASGANTAFEQREISAGEAFRESTDNFGAIWVAIVISTFKIIGGYLLFIVPGVRAQLRYSYVSNIVIKEKLSGTDALNRAKELNKGHLIEMMGINFVGGIIPFVGSLIADSGKAYAYSQIDHVHKNNIETKTHWANYLGLIIAAVFSLLIVLLFVAIAFATN